MLTVANLITLFRISLIPVFVMCFVYIGAHPNMPAVVLLTFTVAAMLDAVDGMVARVFRQKTDLGAFLDPLADKLLVTMVYILGVGYGIPLYVTVVVISRDLLIVLGWGLLHYFKRDAEIRPMWISKVNTACQFVTAIIVLFNLAVPFNRSEAILMTACWITMATTLVSGAACYVEWYKRMGGYTRV